MKNPDWLIRLRSWEYWPMWVLYVPVVLKHLQYTLSIGSPFFFLQVNPGMGKGFILSDPKSEQLDRLPPRLKPKTLQWTPDTPIQGLKEKLIEGSLEYPLIVKPDIGFRGLGVSVVRNQRELEGLLAHIPVTYLVQEYIDLPVELGVFWYRFPGVRRGVVPSLTLKEFMCIRGDGKSTLKGLVEANPRWRLQRYRLKKEYAEMWDQVPEVGKELLLEPVGNHNRGTMFIDGNRYIDRALEERMGEIAGYLPGFYFGRLDLKVNSLADFVSGGPVKVLEVNGVGAEPTHIYQPGYSLWKAWKEMAYLWGIVAGIAQEHRKNGLGFPSFSEAKARYLQYRSYRKKAL